MNIRFLQSFGTITTLTRPTRMRRFGVPTGGPLDPAGAHLLRATLNINEITTLIEVSGELHFEARIPMTIGWMTPSGGYLKQLERFETHKVKCVGCFAGLLGFTAEILPEIRMEALQAFSPQLRFMPIEQHQMFTMTSGMDTNRLGFRFSTPLPYAGKEQPSEPICSGLIQQTPSGQILVVGPDGPVTGGYHKLGVVIEADQWFLAQILPKTELEMIPVSLEIARDAKKELVAELNKRAHMIRLLQGI
jgi:allophanate hydrolase subunit 2